MTEYFIEQYKAGKSFTVVTHAGNTVSISPDTVLQHINSLEKEVISMVRFHNPSQLLSDDYVTFGLSNAVAQAVGSEARYRFYPSMGKIALDTPAIKVDDTADAGLPNGATPEYHYSPYISVACIMRAIYYPTERTMDVLRYASRFVDTELAKIPAHGAAEEYINWLAVECQVRSRRSFDKLKSDFSWGYPVEMFRELSAVDAHMLRTEVNNSPIRISYKSPLNRIEGYPDLALRVTLVDQSINRQSIHYQLCTANGAKSYSKRRGRYNDFYNDLIRLIVRTNLVCEPDMGEFLRNCNILFQDVAHLTKLGRIAERLYVERHNKPLI